MSHGKDAARDLRYGRQGGRWKAPAEPTKPPPQRLPMPETADELRTHLHHSHGCPFDVLDAHQPSEWVIWHAGLTSTTADCEPRHVHPRPDPHRKAQAA